MKKRKFTPTNKYQLPLVKRNLVITMSTALLAIGAASSQTITRASDPTDFPFSDISGDNGSSAFNTTININGGTDDFNNLLLGSNVDANAAPINELQLNSAPLLAPNGDVINRNQGDKVLILIWLKNL